ncbi:MAG: class I SAM-dependent methyltransferase [Candidatus Nanopelagicales bacterium]|jgi:SAM-dependent methyltransferase|nr:class I SAM-dependent methyltransferase [Candidatus Nanopelagicales bacterium]
MDARPPRPDEAGGSGAAGGTHAVGSARAADGADPGRGGIADEEVDTASRRFWEAEADAYQAEHGAFLAGARGWGVDSSNSVGGIDYADVPGVDGSAFVWGPEGLTEAEAGLLGPIEDLRGRRVLEVGCGAAQCSAWLARQGVHAVGIDIAVNQLRHVPRSAVPAPDRSAGPAPDRSAGWAPPSAGPAPDRSAGPAPDPSPTTSPTAPPTPRVVDSVDPADGIPDTTGWGALHVVAATATALPFTNGSFDAAFAAYGAVQFVARLPRLLAEVRRVLRPGGTWVCSVTHPVRWAFPDDPGPAGLTATLSYFDRLPYVERVASGVAVYAEFHRTIGDYVAALRGAGFSIESMVEPEWPEWNTSTWDGWSPLRGTALPGTLIIGCRAADG